MKSYIKKWDEFTVYGFRFSGTMDLCEYVRKARINTKIFPLNKIKEFGSEGSDLEFNGGGWYQTPNLEEAIKLYEDGWNKGYDFFKSLKKSLEKESDKIKIISNDKSKPINILVNLTYSWDTPKQAVINRGVIIQNLINELEKNGYKVNLKAFSLSTSNKELCCIVVDLKHLNEPLDVRKAYFAFCNPSFVRRILFRVMESTDFKDSSWLGPYGYPCNYDFIKKAFNVGKQDIIIPQPLEIGINGNNIVEDWRSFLQYTNLQDYFQF